jgi:hypothetical protein
MRRRRSALDSAMRRYEKELSEVFGPDFGDLWKG